MKVIHILNHFLPDQTAGTEVYVWALCKQLQKLDCKVSVLIPHYASLVSEKYSYDGIEVFKYAEPSKPDRALITGQKISEGLFFFKQYLNEQQPDIVHFHEIAGSNGISVVHLETAKALGFKVVFTLHLSGTTCNTGTLMYQQKTLCDGKINIAKCAYCSLQKRTNNPLYAAAILAASLPFYGIGINTLQFDNAAGTMLSYPFQIRTLKARLKRIEAACDQIIPITDWYKNILLKNGVEEKKLKVVLQALPMSINPDAIASVQESLHLPLRLVFVGRIDKLKGVDLLIKVVAQFSTAELLLDIYGATNDLAFLEVSKAAALAAGNIQWKGVLPQSEVLKTLSGYDALILPSTFSEMSPLVVQEASAVGIPVIGSNVYGIAEQVKDHWNGLLFEMGSAKSLARVLQRLVASPGILAQFSGNIQSPRSFNELADEVYSIYQSLVA